MNNLLRRALLLSSLLLASGCHRATDEVQPHGYDALALATGHWEWEKTTLGFSPQQTPATLGFTRQLTFGTDGRVVIAHGQRPVKTADYALSMGSLAGCGDGPPVPLIAYEADAEVKTGGGSSPKAYTIARLGVEQYLFLTYDYACVDGGAYETYYWVKE